MTAESFASSFFTAGGTLPPDAPSYVERTTDEELFRYVRAGEFCYILTPRQMGKSSLMIRTAQRLATVGIRSAVVDLTQIGTVISEDQWYKGIITQIKRRLHLGVDPVAWWETKGDIPGIQKFITFFEEILLELDGSVVVFMDEIDTTLKLEFRDNFFAGIRSMFNARAENAEFRRITFVLLGVASPSDLIKDRNRTPFNIGQEISLRPFNRTDLAMMERGLDEAYPTLGTKILDRIYYWTNGQPYLTQKLCQSVVDAQVHEYGDNQIDLLVKKLFTSEEASKETNLQFVRDNILGYPERKVILSLYKRILRGFEVLDSKNSLPQNHLKLSGLAHVEGGRLLISNRIYAKVFDLKWVNKYVETNWTPVIYSAFGLVISVLAFILYYNGTFLPNKARADIESIGIYGDDRGIQALADLFQLQPYASSLNEYKYKANDVFFNTLTWDQQRSLLDTSDDEVEPDHEEYSIVVKGLYVNLADVDGSGQSTRLLEIMQSSLKQNGMEKEKLYQEITHWLEARRLVDTNSLSSALKSYNAAVQVNPENPAILFERARIYVRLDDYENALKDYDQVIAIAPQSKMEPTERATILPSKTATDAIAKIKTAPAVLITPSLRVSQESPPQLKTQVPSVETPGNVVSQVTVTAVGMLPAPTFSSSLVTMVTVRPALTATPTPASTAISIQTTKTDFPPLQSQFLTLQQRIKAVRNDLQQNVKISLYLFQVQADAYPNLANNGFISKTVSAGTQMSLAGALTNAQAADATPMSISPIFWEALNTLNNNPVPSMDPYDLACRLKQLCGVVNTLPLIEPNMGDSQQFWIENSDNNTWSQVTATLQHITPHTYFWVEDSVQVDPTVLKSLMDDFENTIYPKSRDYFGSEPSPGVDNDPHIYIVYAPTGSGPGYFTDLNLSNPVIEEHSNGHEMLVINTNQTLSDRSTSALLARYMIYLIETTLDRSDSQWFNNGLTYVNSYINGYDVGGIDTQFLENPDIQLNTLSGLSSANLGESFLFLTYYYDSFGKEALRNLLANPQHDLAGVDDTLKSLDIVDANTGNLKTADDVFLDWATTLYLNDANVINGRYTYQSYSLPAQVPLSDEIHACPQSPQKYTVNQYGVDYINVDCPGNYTLKFTGSAQSQIWPENPHSGLYTFWSNRGDNSDMTLTRKFDLTSVKAPIELNFWVWYEIEPGYDYVHLEASTDGGQTWEIVETPSGLDTGKYGTGYTGKSEQWINENVDLSRYSGKTVLIRFEYITDAALNDTGFLLDDISIGAIGYQSDFETDNGGWEANGFVRVANVLPQFYRLNLILQGDTTTVTQVNLNTANVADIPFSLKNGEHAVLVVTAVTRYTEIPTIYQIEIK